MFGEKKRKKKTKTESPPRLTELDLLYLHEETLDCSFCPLKEKKTSDVSKTAGSGSVARHLAPCFSLAGKRKTLCFLCVSTRVPSQGSFLIHSYRQTVDKLIFTIFGLSCFLW